MQVREDHIGQTVQDADGTPFQIGDDIKTNWKANAQAGVALLARQYQLAELENPFGSLEEWAQQTYSGYSAGNFFRDRYLTTLGDNLPAHPRDRAFLRNFLREVVRSRQQRKQSQPQNTQQSSAQQPAQNQTTGSAAKPSAPSGPEPLPGPLQRLKENPGSLFLQAPATSGEKNQSQPSFRGIDLVPSLSNAPLRARSLGAVASLLFSQQEAVQPPGTRPLPGPLERLKENPGNLLLEPFMRGQHFSQIYIITITEHEGGTRLKGYFPGDPKESPNAGVTIAAGIDLAHQSRESLRGMGLSDDLINKVSPYLGLRGQAALDELNKATSRNRALTITPREADQLNRAVMTKEFNAAARAYDAVSQVGRFTDLPWQAQTVIADLWYNMGGGVRGGKGGLQNTDFGRQVTSGDWDQAFRNLQDFKSKQRRLNDRANDDASILGQALAVGALPRRRDQ